MTGLVILSFLLLMLVAPIIRGFVLSILWVWFVTPLGVPALGIAGAIGISIVVSMLTHQDTATKDRDIGEIIGISLLGPLLVLAIGWVVHLFM